MSGLTKVSGQDSSINHVSGATANNSIRTQVAVIAAVAGMLILYFGVIAAEIYGGITLTQYAAQSSTTWALVTGGLTFMGALFLAFLPAILSESRNNDY